MFESALPLWGDAGLDRKRGGFLEELGLDGRPTAAPFKRTRVTARQIYAFSHASLLGWGPGDALAAAGYAYLVEKAWQGPDCGWARRLTPDGAVLDATPDLYDHAFVLFALAWRYRASGDRDALRRAHDTLDFIERHLRRPGADGFLHALPPHGPRLQNPHMHLVEACLSAFEATGDQRFLDRATDVVRLFRERFFDGRTLAEYFTDDWQRVAGDQGRIVEPGHQFEWAWILANYSRLAEVALVDEISALVAFSERYGVDPATGATFNQVRDDGAPLDRGSRTWPNTERIKGHLAIVRARRRIATSRHRQRDPLAPRSLPGGRTARLLDGRVRRQRPAVGDDGADLDAVPRLSRLRRVAAAGAAAGERRPRRSYEQPRMTSEVLSAQRHMTWRVFALVVAIGTASAAGPPQSVQLRRTEVVRALDLYAAGRADEALALVSRASRDQIRDWRQVLVSYGHAWIHNGPANLSPRIFAAAAFALEMEAVRAERGEWGRTSMVDCGGQCVIEWGCTILRARGVSDDHERTWLLASMALVGGVRDWTFLIGPSLGLTNLQRAPLIARPAEDHLTHALTRHPGEARFRLVRAEAIASRFDIGPEFDVPRAGERARPVGGVGTIGVAGLGLFPSGSANQRRRAQIDTALTAFEVLTRDPDVGLEAKIRLAYLRYRLEDYEQARADAESAASGAADRDVKYTAHFIAGQAAQAMGNLSGAEAQYAAALVARPRSQSAMVALAALQFLRGDASPAYALVNTPRSQADDDDPWRLFFYGDFPRLPALIKDLRARVMQ